MVSTRYMSNEITNWHVSRELSCSDHQHKRFDVEAGTRQELQYRDHKCTDWEGFRVIGDSVENDIRRIRNSVEMSLQRFTFKAQF
ncbi:hypothetical protein JTB14_029572 [Gonioctena quinquepunctata]|nr:hypothetical protein JTB14_029572 [Gonioctena quinquepunctata]